MCIRDDNTIVLRQSGRNCWMLGARDTGLVLDKNATYKTVKQLTESLGIRPIWEKIEEKDLLKRSEVFYMISDDDLWHFFKPGNAVALFRKDGIAHWCVVDEIKGGDVQIIHRYKVDSQCPLDDPPNVFDSIMKKSANAKIVKGSLMAILYPESLRYMLIFKCEDGKDCSDFSVLKARSLLGTPGYNLLSGNCEHFVFYCCTGIKSSNQVLWRCEKYVEVISSVVFALMTLALCLLVTSAFSSLLTAVFGILIAIATYFSCYYYAVHRWPLNEIRTLILDFLFRRQEKRTIEAFSRLYDFFSVLPELKFNHKLFKKMTTKYLDSLSKDYIIAISYIEESSPQTCSVEELQRGLPAQVLSVIKKVRSAVLFWKVWKQVEASRGFLNVWSINDLCDLILHVSAQLRSDREFFPKPYPLVVKKCVADMLIVYLTDLLGRIDIVQKHQICKDFIQVAYGNAFTDHAENGKLSLPRAVLALSQLCDEGDDDCGRNQVFKQVLGGFVEYCKRNLMNRDEEDFSLRKQEHRSIQALSRLKDFYSVLSGLKFNKNLFKKMTTKDLDALSKDYMIAISFFEQTLSHASSMEEIPQYPTAEALSITKAMSPVILFCKVWKEVEASREFGNDWSMNDLCDVILHVSAQLRSDREFAPMPNPCVVKICVADMISGYLKDLLGRINIVQIYQIGEDFTRVHDALDGNASTDRAKDEKPSLAKAVLALSQLIDELQGIDCERRDMIFYKVSADFLEFIKENLIMDLDDD